ncbi:conserved hypothetical protein [Azospirillaceae bacterium]
MAYLDHIRVCNTHDLSGFRPFLTAGRRIGWVRHGLAERLGEFETNFIVSPAAVSLTPELDSFDKRSQAMANVARALANEGLIPKLRRENYPILTQWGAAPLFALDRAAVPAFGVHAFGVHMNGYVRLPDGSIEMWVAKRAHDRIIAPGKLDNLVAGGQPIGLSLFENLLKEAKEEAGIESSQAARALSTGAVSYVMETEIGLKPDTMFIYDLELPEAFIPKNLDGEVETFERWSINKIAEVVRETDQFKFNCNLVIIDFMIRHGVLTPDEADYLELVKGLRK